MPIAEALRTPAPPPIECVDTAPIPNGGLLRLLRCGTSYSICFGEDELMGSTACQSEQALAHLTIAALAAKDRVLIGGLGMGFTLGAALDALPSTTHVVVAELVPKVAVWAREELSHLFGDMLSDPRVTLQIGDVHDVIDRASGEYDAIMLDVDNGPDGFISPANDRLYCNWGLKAAYAALRPGGVLAIWSAYNDDGFSERLAAAGFRVRIEQVPDDGGPDRAPYTIWLATRTDGVAPRARDAAQASARSAPEPVCAV